MAAKPSTRVKPNRQDRTEPVINESLISILLDIYLFFKLIFKKTVAVMDTHILLGLVIFLQGHNLKL